MKIKNGDKVRIISHEGESFLIPTRGTILTVLDADATNFSPPRPAPYCVDSRGNGVWVLMTNLERVSQEPAEQASENPFKVGDRVKVIISEGELIGNGCDESVQSGVVYTIQEVEEESIRLGPEDTCSWVAYDDVDIEPSDGKALTIDHINSFTKHHKDIEISFENGKMEVRDWRGKGDPVEYKCDTVEQLEELMGAWEKLCKFKTGEC